MNFDFSSPWVIGGGVALGVLLLLRGKGGSSAVADYASMQAGSNQISAIAIQEQGETDRVRLQVQSSVEGARINASSAERDSVLGFLAHGQDLKQQTVLATMASTIAGKQIEMERSLGMGALDIARRQADNQLSLGTSQLEVERQLSQAQIAANSRASDRSFDLSTLVQQMLPSLEWMRAYAGYETAKVQNKRSVGEEIGAIGNGIGNAARGVSSMYYGFGGGR